MKTSSVQKYTSSFLYGSKKITFDFWVNTEPDEKPDTIIFLGAGQIGRIAKWVARKAGPGVIVIGGLPHWESSPSGEDMLEFSEHYMQATFDTVRKELQVNILHVVAESQAGPGSVILTGKRSAFVGNLVLVGPLGFNAHVFSGSEQARLRLFRKRGFKTLMQLAKHPKNYPITVIAIRALLREQNIRALNLKYAIGVGYDSRDDFAHAMRSQQEKGNSIMFFFGEKDKVFPPGEALETLVQLAGDDLQYKIVPKVGHASFASPSYGNMLGLALSAARSGTISE